MPRRPAQLPVRAPLTPRQIASARYVGSPEHKTLRWWGGLPEAYAPGGGQASRPGKQQTTICPLFSVQDRDRATGWVQEALRDGHYRFYEGDKDFPKKSGIETPAVNFGSVCVLTPN
jgi:hypothetical protein